jgi:hypothetical protein
MNRLLNPGPEVYYDEGFRAVFEDHLNFILNTKRDALAIETVDENTGARFAGDFRGLMLEMGKEPHMAWFNMRINGYTNCSEYDGSQISLYILQTSVVDKLAAQYRTKKKN